jgi:hypothetical protein
LLLSGEVVREGCEREMVREWKGDSEIDVENMNDVVVWRDGSGYGMGGLAAMQ